SKCELCTVSLHDALPIAGNEEFRLMARINLLPWREQLREERKKQFLSILALIVIVAGLLVFLGDRTINGKIDHQNARNEFLRKESQLLDGRIKEIEQLQARRSQLLERMKIIQDLQG